MRIRHNGSEISIVFHHQYDGTILLGTKCSVAPVVDDKVELGLQVMGQARDSRGCLTKKCSRFIALGRALKGQKIFDKKERKAIASKVRQAELRHNKFWDKPGMGPEPVNKSEFYEGPLRIASKRKKSILERPRHVVE